MLTRRMRGIFVQEDAVKSVDVESNPFVKASAAHIGELTEIVEQCREDERIMRQQRSLVEAAEINQTRIMALTEIHSTKMRLLMMQMEAQERDMMMAARGIVQPRS